MQPPVECEERVRCALNNRGRSPSSREPILVRDHRILCTIEREAFHASYAPFADDVATVQALTHVVQEQAAGFSCPLEGRLATFRRPTGPESFHQNKADMLPKTLPAVTGMHSAPAALFASSHVRLRD